MLERSSEIWLDLEYVGLSMAEIAEGSAMIKHILQVKEDGTSIKAYGKGLWFGPCWFSEVDCFKELDAGIAAGTWNMTGLVGAHRFQNSWG